MQIRLGYVSIAPTLSDKTTSRTMTFTSFKKLGEKRALEKLLKITNENLNDLIEILKYNVKNEIYFYRMSSNIFPLIDVIEYDLINHFKEKLEEIGDFANKNKIRLSMHLNHFYVLNSLNEKVVSSTINILNIYKNIFKTMKVDGTIVLHVGSKALGKREGMKRFCENFLKLDIETRRLLILENDDKVYNVKNTLNICNKLNIPMCLDYHHFLCNKTNEKIEDYIIKIFNTWKKRPKVHFSSPESKKNFRAHNDYIDIKTFLNFIEKIKFCNIDFDIMIEAKMKETAVFKLVRELKYYTNYKFIKETIFEVE